MKITAITIWKDIVSPVYDAAEWVLLVSPEGKREIVHTRRMSIFEKTELLKNNQASILICGAISNLAYADLKNKEIEVIPWIRSSVEEVLQAHAQNKLDEDPYLLPGCRGVCPNHGKLQIKMRNKRYRYKVKAVSTSLSPENLDRHNKNETS
jgi:predicted Fe-Mo cluster-binding NifX family protein